MHRGRSTDTSFWMIRTSLNFTNKNYFEATLKMFGSKAHSSNSTFYTELESDTKDEEPVLNKMTECRDEYRTDDPSNRSDMLIDNNKEQQGYNGHSFRRIATFGGFSWFRPFVMSAGSSTEQVDVSENEENSLEVPFVRVSHGVLEYRSSR